MKFTFGIITKGVVDKRILSSIVIQNIPAYEIIVVGGVGQYNSDFVNHIPFDDTYNAPYTIKKNLITKNATFDNIVYLHDYLCFNPDWYSGFLKFDDDWDICMTKIENNDGSRFRDWCAWDDPELCWKDLTPTEEEIEEGYKINYHSPQGIFRKNHRIALVPYNYNKIKYMYISGGYWIAKKYVMEEEPLNETLSWGQGEDVEWSRRTIKNKKFNYKMNTYSVVKCLKDKKLSAEVIE